MKAACYADPVEYTIETQIMEPSTMLLKLPSVVISGVFLVFSKRLSSPAFVLLSGLINVLGQEVDQTQK